MPFTGRLYNQPHLKPGDGAIGQLAAPTHPIEKSILERGEEECYGAWMVRADRKEVLFSV